MAMIPCPKCGESISEQSKFCIHCGAKFVKDVCPACGAEIEENAKFCANCGNQIEKAKPAPVQKVERKTEQKEETQEIPGPFEIVEGWKQSSAFARFLCGGLFTFIDILFTMIIVIFALFGVAFGLFSVMVLKEEMLIYVCSFILALSLVGLIVRVLLNGELIPFYFRFSISRWIQKQGYDPLAIAKKISKLSRQEDIRSPKATTSMSTYVLHPYVSVDAAFMVAVREGKTQAIISIIISVISNCASMFFLALLSFFAFSGLLLNVAAGETDIFMPFILSLLTNPLLWIEIVIWISFIIPTAIINSKREKRKGVWLSSVY